MSHFSTLRIKSREPYRKRHNLALVVVVVFIEQILSFLFER
jgi:hypothetical protein